MCFSTKLKKLRTEKELTQKELSSELKRLYDINFSNRNISYYEREENGATIPDLKIVEALANYFNVSTNYLLGISEKSQEEEIVKRLTEKTDDNTIKWYDDDPSKNYNEFNDRVFENYSRVFNRNYFLQKLSEIVDIDNENICYNVYYTDISGNFYVLIDIETVIHLYYVETDIEFDTMTEFYCSDYKIIKIGDSSKIPAINDLLESATIDDNQKNRTSTLNSLLDNLNNID